MRVKATRPGFYGDHYVKKGEVFDLKSPADFSDSTRRAPYGIGWMKVVEATKDELAQAAAAEKKRREGAMTIAKAAVVVPPPEGVDRGDPEKRDNIAGAKIVTGRRPDGSNKPEGSTPEGEFTGGDGAKNSTQKGESKPETKIDPKAGTGSKDVLS